MSSLNKVQLIGRLGRDPEVRYTQTGDAIANITVATSESWKDKDGNKKESTEWHKVVLPRKLGEIAGQYLKKGSLVYIEGSLKTRKWQDKDGQDRYTTEIVATEMKMLGGRDDHGSDQRPPQNNGAQQQPAGNRQPQRTPPARSGGGGGNGDDYGQFGEDIPFTSSSFMAEPMLRSRSRRV